MKLSPAAHLRYLKNRFNVSGFDCLTPMELQVAKEVSYGLIVKEIAAKYNLSFKTIETHKRAIYKKLNIETVGEMTRRYIYEFEIPAMVLASTVSPVSQSPVVLADTKSNNLPNKS